MDWSILISTLGAWIVCLFPSLSAYTKWVTPISMAVFTLLGIFTNYLPEPNHTYPIPDVTDLEAQLQGSGQFFLKIARFTRTLTIIVNWFIATAVYSWFYNFTNHLSSFVSRFKKTPAPLTK